MSISNTPKRNTVVFNSNNDNDNIQTPKNQKTQTPTKRNRATPSPMRTRKPLFDDTPPVQRYKVQMAKNRLDTSKNYRKEIRNIFHQSDQFAIFQQKSALVVPTELTPERYILGKFNAQPEAIQKDRGISRKVTRRADLYDFRNRNTQDTHQVDNNEVLVEEIEEIDVITEEQQNMSNSSGQMNNNGSNEHQESDTHLHKENNIIDTNNRKQNQDENNFKQYQHNNDLNEHKEPEIEEEEEINVEISIEVEEEDKQEVANNTNTHANDENLPNQLLEEEEQPENEETQNENGVIASENQNNEVGNENEEQNNEEDVSNLNIVQRDVALQNNDQEQPPETIENEEKDHENEQQQQQNENEHDTLQNEEKDHENTEHHQNENEHVDLQNEEEDHDNVQHQQNENEDDALQNEEEDHEDAEHQQNEANDNQENAEQQQEQENTEQQEQEGVQDQQNENGDHESHENAEPQQEENESNLDHHQFDFHHENESHQELIHQAITTNEEEIPVPEFEETPTNSIRNRNAAQPFMPPSSPPRFKKLDRNDPKIGHTGDQLLEISLRPYLYTLTNKYGTPINKIREIPEMEFNDWQSMGFDWVWLYGVWQIGDYVIDHDLKDSTLLNRYNEVLPDWKREDVIGYPLCIYKYEVCPEVGTEEDLHWFRMEMKKRGIKLMLDFVPNDTAIDAPEMTSNPEFYIRSTVSPNQEIEFDSNRFMKDRNGVAFGSGEFMPPMHFNAQLNLFNKKCRDYQIDRIYKVSHLCDGLRVHLAQYLINSKFAEFWGNELFNQNGINKVDIDYKNEDEEFWFLAISKIREENPNFVMMAESYGYENQEKLLNCGFNYVYEKELLDKLVYSDVKGFRDLIFNNEFLTSKKMVHFVENHDEARILHHFWKNERMACAASAALLTLPGIRLINFHQWLGYMNQIDVNLRRSYEPHMNKHIMLFYVRLLRVLDTNAIRFGQWTPKNVYDSDTVFAWKWVKGKQHVLVTVNFCDNRSGGRVICDDAPTETREITVHELITNTYYTRDPQELIDTGLILSLDKYETQIFEY